MVQLKTDAVLGLFIEFCGLQQNTKVITPNNSYSIATRSDKSNKKALSFCTQVSGSFVSVLSKMDSSTSFDTHLSSLSLQKGFLPVSFNAVTGEVCASQATAVYCAGITKRQTAHSASQWFYHILFINWLYLISMKSHLSLLASTLITKQKKAAIHTHIDDCTSCFLDHTSINCMFPSKKHHRSLLFEHPWGPFTAMSVQDKSRPYLQPGPGFRSKCLGLRHEDRKWYFTSQHKAQGRGAHMLCSKDDDYSASSA